MSGKATIDGQTNISGLSIQRYKDIRPPPWPSLNRQNSARIPPQLHIVTRSELAHPPRMPLFPNRSNSGSRRHQLHPHMFLCTQTFDMDARNCRWKPQGSTGRNSVKVRTLKFHLNVRRDALSPPNRSKSGGRPAAPTDGERRCGQGMRGRLCLGPFRRPCDRASTDSIPIRSVGRSRLISRAVVRLQRNVQGLERCFNMPPPTSRAAVPRV